MNFTIGKNLNISLNYAHLEKNETIIDFFDLKPGDEKLLREKEKVRVYYISKEFSTTEQIQLINTYDHIKETRTSGHSWEIKNKEVPAGFSPEQEEEKFRKQRKKGDQSTYDAELMSEHYIIKDTRYINNKYSLVAMYLMLEEAREKGAPFYKDYKEADKDRKPVTHSFEHEIPSTEQYSSLAKFLDFMQGVRKNPSIELYTIPPDIRPEIYNKYLHLSAHYGGFSNDFIDIKSGDHHWMGDMGFINQPVKYTYTNGRIEYTRKKYEPQ